MLPPKYAGLDEDPPWFSIRRLWVGVEVRKQDVSLAKAESAASSKKVEENGFVRTLDMMTCGLWQLFKHASKRDDGAPLSAAGCAAWLVEDAVRRRFGTPD